MRVDGAVVGAIGSGLLVLLGVTHTDTPADADRLAERVAKLRIFPDVEAAGAGRTDGPRSMNAPLGDRRVLVVSQFTLYGDTSRGHRPSWGAAAPGAVAEPLYTRFADALEAARGVFGADMAVSLVNDGPVTLLLESR